MDFQPMDRIDDACNGLMGEDFMHKTRERLHWICSKVNGTNVMDVGCSQGTLARLLAPLGKSVLGIDINEDAISYADARLREVESSLRERLQFVAANFMDYKPSGCFDTVVMGEVLEHHPAPEAFVKKAWTHLFPGGTLVMTVPFGAAGGQDRRQMFCWSWMKEHIEPLFDIVDVAFFGKWIGVVGIKRDRKSHGEKSIPLSAEKEQLSLLLEMTQDENVQLQEKNAESAKCTAAQTARVNETQTVKKNQGEKRTLETTDREVVVAQQKIIDALKKQITALENESAEQKKEVGNLRNESAEQKKEIAAQKGQVDTAQRLVAELQKSLADLLQQYAELKTAKTKAVRLYNEKAAKVKELSAKYNSLAESKLGRLILAWRRMKRRWDAATITHQTKTENRPPMAVSVIIPTFKDNPYIDKAIESILSQDYPGLIAIFLCVNGGDKAYCKKLKKKYSKIKNLKVLFTSKKGVNAGRNLGIAHIKTPLFTFLDDDDYFTQGYIRELARGFDDERVNISTGRMEDLDNSTGSISKTYYTEALRKADKQFTTDYYAIGVIFGTFCMKMYRTSFFISTMGELSEKYRHSEDVMFWAEHFGSLEGPIYIANPDSSEAYIRRKTDNSLSRPRAEDAYKFHVSDRLSMICEMGNLLRNPSFGRQHKQFLMAKIKTQTSIIKKYFDTLSGAEAAKAQSEIFRCDCPFLNKAVFCSASLAVVHNFSP